MDLSQTKLIGLTMQLELKAREYDMLCNKLDQLKKNNINPNDERLLTIKELFQQNYEEIAEINKKLIELKESEETLEKQKLKQYNPENLFKNKNNNTETVDIIVVKNKKNVFTQLIKKIKSFFGR